MDVSKNKQTKHAGISLRSRERSFYLLQIRCMGYTSGLVFFPLNSNEKNPNSRIYAKSNLSRFVTLSKKTKHTREKQNKTGFRVIVPRHWKPHPHHASSALRVKFSIHSLSSQRFQTAYVPYRSWAAEMLMDGWLWDNEPVENQPLKRGRRWEAFSSQQEESPKKITTPTQTSSFSWEMRDTAVLARTSV